MANEGAIFGEMNIFNVHGNRRRTCDVISCGYSELFVLTSDDVATTLKKYPRVMVSAYFACDVAFRHPLREGKFWVKFETLFC